MWLLLSSHKYAGKWQQVTDLMETLSGYSHEVCKCPQMSMNAANHKDWRQQQALHPSPLWKCLCHVKGSSISVQLTPEIQGATCGSNGWVSHESNEFYIDWNSLPYLERVCITEIIGVHLMFTKKIFPWARLKKKNNTQNTNKKKPTTPKNKQTKNPHTRAQRTMPTTSWQR